MAHKKVKFIRISPWYWVFLQKNKPDSCEVFVDARGRKHSYYLGCHVIVDETIKSPYYLVYTFQHNLSQKIRKVLDLIHKSLRK